MLDVEALRSEFPALHGSQVYLDAPAGTQVPNVVIRAMSEALSQAMSNVGGSFASSRRAESMVAAARAAGADLVKGVGDEIVFGPSMTSLTFALSRAVAETWRPGDRIILSALDHDANITPWLLAAAARQVRVEFVDFDPDTTSLDLGHLQQLLERPARLVALTACSNAFGTLVDVARAAAASRSAGALCFVDAVHLAPHRRVDVEAIGADFLVCSSYKFFGPHLGMLWMRQDLLESLPAFRVRPAPDRGPGRWETGTPPFEQLAGFAAAVDYLASIGWGGDRRGALDSAFNEIARCEAAIGRRFLNGLPASVRVIGMPAMEGRVPTFALDTGSDPRAVAARLGERNIAVWAGHHYAVEPMERLGFDSGLLRIGFTHLSTPEEVDRVLEELSELES